jgi:hypothetical protein
MIAARRTIVVIKGTLEIREFEALANLIIKAGGLRIRYGRDSRCLENYARKEMKESPGLPRG